MEDGVTDMIEGNINNTFKKIHLDDPRRTPEIESGRFEQPYPRKWKF